MNPLKRNSNLRKLSNAMGILGLILIVGSVWGSPVLFVVGLVLLALAWGI